MVRQLKIYALYEGEHLLDTGTIKELSERHNVAQTTLRFMKSPAYQRRLDAQKSESNARRVICIGYDDE